MYRSPVFLHNTLSGEKEPLVPIRTDGVRIYNCGPTVYDYAHVGNFRTIIFNDVLRRTLEYTGYNVIQMMNITDIDDKIIARAKRDEISIQELTKTYTEIFFEDLVQLNIKTPTLLPRATEHVDHMIALIEKLLKSNHAYVASDGVYFDVATSPEYGKLARLDMTAETESRIKEEHLDKHNERDFALWKFWTEDDGDCVYDAPFGRGRPGWHIECSAMAMGGLGETLDIHTGGADLIFPHHTNEIAQSEAISGKPFAHLWVHHEFIMIEGQKMSKSLDNIITLKTIIDREFSPLAFRYYVLGGHHTAKANFTWEALRGAETARERIQSHMTSEIGTPDKHYTARFRELISDDLDTPQAIALLWDVIKNSRLSPEDKTATILDFDTVLGLGFSASTTPISEPIPEAIQSLLERRNTARAEKDWSIADGLRDELVALGYEIIDTPQGNSIVKPFRP